MSSAGDSIVLNWAEPPPELSGDLQRAITQYAVTVTPDNGGPSKTVLFPAVAESDFTITDLDPDTTYDIQYSAVINTEGQGEVTYDLGAATLSATTTNIGRFFFVCFCFAFFFYTELAMPSI